MERRARIAFGVFDLMAAALVMVGIFQGLPARYWPIDVVAGGVALLLTAGGVSLLAGARWTPQVSRVASLLVLAVGLLFLAALAVSASYLAGIYYYFGEEHWTCQAVEELWDRAPDARALDFCVRWNAYARRMQLGPGETPLDSDGAFGIGPVFTPSLAQVGSRCEAAIAVRRTLAQAHGPPGELHALDAELRRSLALLVRKQLLPGPTHLFTAPDAVFGAMPGSEVDWQLRIDYAQHAGSAMLRWIDPAAP